MTKQEPVAWVKDNLICPENGYETTITEQHPKDLGWTPLYTHHAPLQNKSAESWQGNKEFVGLNDDEIDSVWFEVVKENNFEGTGKYFARAIEQALKEKNT